MAFASGEGRCSMFPVYFIAMTTKRISQGGVTRPRPRPNCPIRTCFVAPVRNAAKSCHFSLTRQSF